MKRIGRALPRARALCAVLLLVTATAARGACEYPPAVRVPDGSTATETEMQQARAEIKAYLAAMEAYLGCLEAEEAALPEEQRTPERQAITVKRHNAAVDAMEDMAARFNEQLRAFDARRQSPGP